MSTIMELVTFNLNDGVTNKQFLTANENMKTFLNDQPGFVHRSLSANNEGQWFDVIYWENETVAKAAAEAFMKSDVCASIMPLIDAPSCKMQHLNVLSETLSDNLI